MTDFKELKKRLHDAEDKCRKYERALGIMKQEFTDEEIKKIKQEVGL